MVLSMGGEEGYAFAGAVACGVFDLRCCVPSDDLTKSEECTNLPISKAVMEQAVLMPGKLSRAWRELCKRVSRRGSVTALQEAKVAYYVWLAQQYDTRLLERHIFRIERALHSIYQEMEAGAGRERSGGQEL